MSPACAAVLPQIAVVVSASPRATRRAVVLHITRDIGLSLFAPTASAVGSRCHNGASRTWALWCQPGGIIGGRGVGCPFYALPCRPREERANRNDRSALFFPFQHHRFCALTDAGGRQAGAGKGTSMSAFSQLPIACAASRRTAAVAEWREPIAKTN